MRFARMSALLMSRRVAWLAVATYVAAGIGPAEASESARRWEKWLVYRTSEIPDSKAFPRFAWSYFGYANQNDISRDVGIYAAAGLSDVQVRLRGDLPSKAKDNGLRLILGTWEASLERPERFDAIMQYAGKDRSVSMILLKDEPDARWLEAIGQLHSRMFGELGDHVLALLTVLPGHAARPGAAWRFNPSLACSADGSYCDFLRQILTRAKPSAILPTLYAVYDDGSERADFYEQLATVRDLTKAYGIGHFGSVVVTPHLDGWSGKRYRSGNRADVFWQAYSHIAFNAKGLAFYSYRTKPEELSRGPYVFGEGLVTSIDGDPTPAYEIVKELNCEIGGLGKKFLTLQAGKVYGIGMQTGRGLEPGLPASLSVVEGNTLLISEMRARHSDETYLLLVNARHGRGAEAEDIAFKVRFGLRARRHAVTPQCASRVEWMKPADGWFRVTVPAGGAVLLEIVNSTRAVHR
ncbi:MAG TPA: hypothetical protein VFU31_01270 [Candidatus Binatia bacterium]|nr:hypothetical protein [Candidatus Binatia bacterium]